MAFWVSQARFRKVFPWAVFALMAGCSIYLRFHHLTRESIWLDEAITWQRAHLPVPEMIADCVEHLHNPSFFLFMRLYLQLGDDELMMRLPSAVLGSLTLLATAVIGYVCGGYRAALGAMTILALSPLKMRYDQEARMYAQYGLAAATMLGGLFWLLLHPQHASQPLFGWRRRTQGRTTPGLPRKAKLSFVAVWAGGTLSWYTHNTAALLLFCAALCVALSLPTFEKSQRLPMMVNYALINLLILIAYTPWLSSLVSQTKRLHERFWSKFPTTRVLRKTFLDLYLYGGQQTYLALLMLAFAGAALWALRRQKALLTALLLLSFLTPALLLLISLERPIFIPRLMLWTSIPFSVLLALGLGSFPRRLFWPLFAAMTILGVVNLNEVYFRRRFKPNYLAALQSISNHPQAITLLANSKDEIVFDYFSSRQTRPVQGIHYVNVAKDKKVVAATEKAIVGTTTVFVARWKKWPPLKPIYALLSRRAKRVRTRSYGHGLRVHEFQMNGTK